MIWATVSSRSCFCWLYRASPSLAAKNIQSDFGIDHLVMSMCRVMFCWRRVFAMTSAFSWQNSVILCPASFCIPRLCWLTAISEGATFHKIIYNHSVVQGAISKPYPLCLVTNGGSAFLVKLWLCARKRHMLFMLALARNAGHCVSFILSEMYKNLKHSIRSK